MEHINAHAFAKGLVHNKLALTRRFSQEFQKFICGFLVKIFSKAQPVPAVLERANRLLKCFLVVLADAHDLADGAHLRTQLVFDSFEFLKSPASKLYDHILSRRRIFLQRAVAPIWHLVHRQAASQHG